MIFNPSVNKLVALDNWGFPMLIGKFPEGFECEEDLLSVSLKDFWDPVELLYVIKMD